MALADFQQFLAERLSKFFPSEDFSAGSSADVQVIQPILRRIGTDPYTVDLGVFLRERIAQEFPELATLEGDAITDLLIKTTLVLWDPLVRETRRIRNSLSFRDPTTLTLDEATALGANLFADPDTGDYARGVGRIYFAQVQNVTVSPANLFTSRTGLRFAPTEVQSIRTEEMLFNQEGSLYYFDVQLVAERAGDAYNIEPEALVTIANVSSAVRVTNKARFREGAPAEDAVAFASRVDQELAERSLVQARGITSKLKKAFPGITRLAVVGTGDSDMQRDVLRGGGLGTLLAAGTSGRVLPDGETRLLSRRFSLTASEAAFTSLLGATGPVGGYVLTLHNAFAAVPLVRDLNVRAVVDALTLDVDEQVLSYSAMDLPWSLRRKELTLSALPGGLLFPDSDGLARIPNDQVHVGGATDVLARGLDFDSASLILSDVVDDTPVLSGVALVAQNDFSVALNDLREGRNYSIGDATHQALLDAVTHNYALQILDPPLAGIYRILTVDTPPGGVPLFTVTPASLSAIAAPFRWRLLDVLDVDLIEPKETKISGIDMVSVQGVDSVETAAGIDFSAYGVAAGDILRIRSGSVAGDYTVQEVLTPLFRRIRVDRVLSASVSNLSFSVFRPNAEGGIDRPLVRIDSIDLLDAAAQPIGSKVPYARAVDAQSRAFANISHGVKVTFTDGILGIVSLELPPDGVNLTGLTLIMAWLAGTLTINFVGISYYKVDWIVDRINAFAGCRLAVLVGTNRFGLLPVFSDLAVVGGSALSILFGTAAAVTTGTIRSAQTVPDWSVVQPAIDSTFDAAQVFDGGQAGFYRHLEVAGGGYMLQASHGFFPEVGRHVQVGSRSLGSARVYFLEPTSVQFGADAFFTHTDASGAVLRFLPDPTLSHQQIPALPSGTKPKDGLVHTFGNTASLETSSLDFVRKGIQTGDTLVIDYQPIIAIFALTDPVSGLHGHTLILSIDGGAEKNIIFAWDDPSIPTTAVTRQGVVDQINRAVGEVICHLTASYYLEFEADALIHIRSTGTANALLGVAVGADVDGRSPIAGSYKIDHLQAATSLTFVPSSTLFPSSPTSYVRQQFKILRPGIQRICATDMAKQVTSAGLYYMDVELMSEGCGDTYNIPADEQLTATGYEADGYWLTTEDSDLAFSVLERPHLHLSRSILEVGTSDDPENATQLSGQNLQLNYSRSSLVYEMQTFVNSESERVTNETILVKHLLPYFVRFDLSYLGGAKETDLAAQLSDYIRNIYPDEALQAVAVQKMAVDGGATSVTSPVDLVAVIHLSDRSIRVERSRDRLNTGRLAAFFPDVLNVTRSIR